MDASCGCRLGDHSSHAGKVWSGAALCSCGCVIEFPPDVEHAKLTAKVITNDVGPMRVNDGDFLIHPKWLRDLVSLRLHKLITAQELRDMVKDRWGNTEYASPQPPRPSRAVDLEATVRSVVGLNPKAVADYQAGKTRAMDVLVGQVLKVAGRVEPSLVRDLLVEVLRQS